MTIKQIFLDRDGVINQRIVSGYITHPEAFKLLLGVKEKLLAWHAAGYKMFVVTNQKGIGKGLMSTEDLASVHHKMEELLGFKFEKIKYCDALDDQDFRRKPQPGMLLELFDEYPTMVAKETLFIGDSLTDLQAGKAAGVNTCFINHGNPPDDTINQFADLNFAQLADVEWLSK